MSPAPRRLLVPLVLVLAGCASGKGDEAARATAESSGAGSDSVATAPPVVAIAASGIHELARRRGAGATMVNVWATWCAPCREEFPALMRVARARAADGLRLVLVSADVPDQIPDVQRFLARHGVTDTSYIQTGKEMEFIERMSPRWSGALPATFVYNREGALEVFWEGAADEDRFNRAVDQVVADRSSGRSASP